MLPSNMPPENLHHRKIVFHPCENSGKPPGIFKTVKPWDPTIEANHRLLPDGQLIQSWQPKKSSEKNSRHLAKRLRAWDWMFQNLWLFLLFFLFGGGEWRKKNGKMFFLSLGHVGSSNLSEFDDISSTKCQILLAGFAC